MYNRDFSSESVSCTERAIFPPCNCTPSDGECCTERAPCNCTPSVLHSLWLVIWTIVKWHYVQHRESQCNCTLSVLHSLWLVMLLRNKSRPGPLYIPVMLSIQVHPVLRPFAVRHINWSQRMWAAPDKFICQKPVSIWATCLKKAKCIIQGDFESRENWYLDGLYCLWVRRSTEFAHFPRKTSLAAKWAFTIFDFKSNVVAVYPAVRCAILSNWLWHQVPLVEWQTGNLLRELHTICICIFIFIYIFICICIVFVFVFAILSKTGFDTRFLSSADRQVTFFVNFTPRCTLVLFHTVPKTSLCNHILSSLSSALSTVFIGK